MEKEGELPVFTNPTYVSSTNSETDSKGDTSSLELKAIDYKNSESGSSTYSTLDPIEALRNLAREISPGITIVPIRKESMSDPESIFNVSFPVIVSRRPSLNAASMNASLSERRQSKSDESYWDSHQNRSSSLFSKKSSYNDEVFDIDQILNLKPKYFGFTRKQWLTLFVFAFVNVFSAIVINLQAPFYPEIAEKKGATDVEIGFVFGSFEFIVFSLSPIFGKYMDKLGPKRVFNVGILVTGVCSILFGFLTFVENRVAFVGISLLLRLIEATGTAGHVTATFTLIAVEFPDSIFTVFASMETCSGLGLILGPLLGSVLYEAGSFVGPNFQFLLPFVSLGGILFVGAVMAYFIMPTPQGLPQKGIPKKKYSQDERGLLDLFKIRSVSLAAFSIFATAVSLGFHSSSLEPHVRQFGVQNVSKGAIFVINGGIYAVTAPIVGKICDHSSNPKLIILTGGVLIFLGYTLIGPAPFFPFESILWVTCLGLFIQGFGLSCSFVSAFTLAMRDSLESGFPDSVSTYGIVSGLWMSMFALGNCVGPIAAGFLIQNLNYRLGTLFVMGLQFLVVGITLIFICKSNDPKSKDSELEIHDGGGTVAVKQAKFYNELTPPPLRAKERPENEGNSKREAYAESINEDVNLGDTEILHHL